MNLRQKAIGERCVAIVTDDHVAAVSTGDKVSAVSTQDGVVTAAGENVVDRTQVGSTEIWIHRGRCRGGGDVAQHTRSTCGIELRSSIVAKDYVVTIGEARGQACGWIDVDVVRAQSTDDDAAAASHIDQIVVTKRWIHGCDLRKNTDPEHQIVACTAIVSEHDMFTDPARNVVGARSTDHDAVSSGHIDQISISKSRIAGCDT